MPTRRKPPTKSLDDAIRLHARHMADPSTATDASQRLMMRQMERHRDVEMGRGGQGTAGPRASLPVYRRNSLRPNPHVAEPARGDLAYAQGTIMWGDFGDDGAAVRPALGLPPTSPPPKEGQLDDTKAGWQ